jgi:hypothetical protein
MYVQYMQGIVSPDSVQLIMLHHCFEQSFYCFLRNCCGDYLARANVYRAIA